MPIGPDSDVGAAPNLFQIGGMDVVGVGDKSGSYYAIERLTGELLWTTKLTQGSSVGGVIASAAYADGNLYVSSNQNFRETHVFALRAEDGDVLWTRQYPGVTYGNPALAGDLLFTTTTSVSATGSMPPRVFALRIGDGEEAWSGALPAEAGGGASVVGPHLLTGYGFHFFDDGRDPLIVGGLAVFRLGDAIDDGLDGGSVGAAGTHAGADVQRDLSRGARALRLHDDDVPRQRRHAGAAGPRRESRKPRGRSGRRRAMREDRPRARDARKSRREPAVPEAARGSALRRTACPWAAC